MLAGIAMQAQGAHRSAIEDYMAVLQMGCDSRGLDKYAHYLLSEVRGQPMASIVCSGYR
jgi:hypothetical protein